MQLSSTRPATPPASVGPLVADLRAPGLASFVDERSGLRMELHWPRPGASRWREYLDGAEARYRRYGLDALVTRPDLDGGGTASLVFVAVDDHDRVVGGVRCHGPLLSVASAAALQELDGSPRLGRVHRMVAQRLAAGVVEIKGGWTTGGGAHPGLSDALARCHVHAMNWFAVRWAMCTASLTTATRWATSGGRPMPGLAPVPYPDNRYETVLLWWERDNVARQATPEQWELIVRESATLGLDAHTGAEVAS